MYDLVFDTSSLNIPSNASVGSAAILPEIVK